MSALVDTSVLIDYLRGHESAAELLETERSSGVLHASEITRLEVLAGMRPEEEEPTRLLLSTLVWHEIDAEVAEQAGALGRRWLPSHHGIDGADLAIAATAILTGASLLTLNVRHFRCSKSCAGRTESLGGVSARGPCRRWGVLAAALPAEARKLSSPASWARRGVTRLAFPELTVELESTAVMARHEAGPGCARKPDRRASDPRGRLPVLASRVRSRVGLPIPGSGDEIGGRRTARAAAGSQSPRRAPPPMSRPATQRSSPSATRARATRTGMTGAGPVRAKASGRG